MELEFAVLLFVALYLFALLFFIYRAFVRPAQINKLKTRIKRITVENLLEGGNLEQWFYLRIGGFALSRDGDQLIKIHEVAKLKYCLLQDRHDVAVLRKQFVKGELDIKPQILDRGIAKNILTSFLPSLLLPLIIINI